MQAAGCVGGAVNVSTGFDGCAFLSRKYRKGGCEGGAHAKVRNVQLYAVWMFFNRAVIYSS